MTWVGVHIRRRDYGQHLRYHYGTGYVHPKYFSRTMKYFRDKYQNVVFVVVSDDMEWAIKNIDNHNKDVFFLGNRNVSSKVISSFK